MFLEARERRAPGRPPQSPRGGSSSRVTGGAGSGGESASQRITQSPVLTARTHLAQDCPPARCTLGAVCLRRDLAACALRASPARSPSLVSLSTPAGLGVAPDSCGGDNLGSPRSPQTCVGRRVLAVVALGSIFLHRAGASPATLGLIPVARMGSGAGLKAGPLVKTWGPLSEGKEETAARPRQPASSTSGRAVASLLPSAGVRVTHVRPLCEMSSS